MGWQRSGLLATVDITDSRASMGSVKVLGEENRKAFSFKILDRSSGDIADLIAWVCCPSEAAAAQML